MLSLFRTSLPPRASLQISRLGSVRALHVNQDGSPDKRFFENKGLKWKKDGTLDLRFKGAAAFKAVVEVKHPPALGRPKNKDGYPDLRFSPTFRYFSAKEHGGLARDGKPDMRMKVNQLAAAEAKAAEAKESENKD